MNCKILVEPPWGGQAECLSGVGDVEARMHPGPLEEAGLRGQTSRSRTNILLWRDRGKLTDHREMTPSGRMAARSEDYEVGSKVKH